MHSVSESRQVQSASNASPDAKAGRAREVVDRLEQAIGRKSRLCRLNAPASRGGHLVDATRASDTEGPSEAVRRAVRRTASDWRTKLIDFGRRNPALYFKELKAGTLTLPTADHPALQALAAERAPLDLHAALEPGPDLTKRLSTIRGKAKENEEERGLSTLFVAIGMASWKAPEGEGSDPSAPMFMLPVAVKDTARGPQLLPNGELVANGVLLQAWEHEHNISVPEFDDEQSVEGDLTQAFAVLERAGRDLVGFRVNRNCYLSNFSFAKMAMYEDLKRYEELLVQNRLVRAMAGDVAAQRDIREAAGTVEREELDDIEPDDEVIVLEADEYQRQAIASLSTFDAEGVIDGPPGTGKSQTIANLIAALVASGKTVLFVAEKRAALDAVRNRLAAAQLDDLLLDLHGADARRKTVYDRLRQRDERSRLQPPAPPPSTGRRIKQLRRTLTAYYRAVNEPLAPSGESPKNLMARLARIKSEAHGRSLWYGPACKTLTPERHEEARARIDTAAQDHPIFRRDPATPWALAGFTEPEQAARAMQDVQETQALLERLRGGIAPLAACVGCTTLGRTEAAQILASAAAVVEVARVFPPAVLDLDVDDVALSLRATAGHPVQRFFAPLVSPRYRSVMKALRSVASAQSNAATLRSSIERLANVPENHRARALFALADAEIVRELSTVRSAVEERLRRIAAAVHIVFADRLAEVGDELARLADAGRLARRVPEVRSAEAWLRANDYGIVVDELLRTALPPPLWAEMADSAWLRSHLEEAKNADATLGAFSREKIEGALDEFRTLDEKLIHQARAVVRRSSSQAYIEARNQNPQQATVLRAELQKKRSQMPIRRLVRNAGDVITALCPCWMASPLSVSQLIDGRVLFDVVIFDEASQVMPEDAVPSIMRGKRTIVAGDQKQLPPTAFFAAGTLADDDDEPSEEAETSEIQAVSLEGIESILDAMIVYCNRQYLNVHYRSLDESLIRFSNHEFYNDRLVTFPGSGILEGGIRHVLVDAPSVDGEELSSSAEIRAVADLVMEHAENRPSETLGVIALGIKHARRLEAVIDERRRGRPDLGDFFEQGDVNRSFFVKNLERVQGDERDAVLISLGYAKNGAGRLRNRMGPLNYGGGERRLNVAVTRSKARMTVVSTFTEDDIDPARFSAPGAQKLCRFIEYARSGGTKLSDVETTDEEMNDFERDVFDTLSSLGLRLVPQVGTSNYRLDFGVLHPTIPNKYILAIECDGAPYHSSKTARDRDRLRQAHLEARGWRFHRIWSPDWHEQRAQEIERVMKAHAAATAGVAQPNSNASRRDEIPPVEDGVCKRSRRPTIAYARSINDVPEHQIQTVLDWIASDRVLRDDDELLREVMSALGFARRGRIIDERLTRSIKIWHSRRSPT